MSYAGSTSVAPIEKVKTRFFVLSDSHGDSLKTRPDLEVDVAIHCGDLTEESKLDEFRTSIQLLKDIKAPLKLVIAGNHDFTLDDPVYENKLRESRMNFGDDRQVRKEYGEVGEARKLLTSDGAKEAGIVFLDEGIHQFQLSNGALLTVYASPYTPSLGDSGWGFQYHVQQEHVWAMDKSVDVAITHCPPRGVLDMTDSRQRAGSAGLFAAIARNRPLMHCFGHIHEGWGAKNATWRPEPSDNPSHFTDIDNEESHVIDNLSGLRPKKFDTAEEIAQKKAKVTRYREQGYVAAGVSPRKGKETLFVNAAIEGAEDEQQQFSWMVELELPGAREQLCKKRKADEGENAENERLKRRRCDEDSAA